MTDIYHLSQKIEKLKKEVVWLFFIRDDFTGEQFTVKKEKKLENLSIKLSNTQNNFELIFHIMYRPPSTKNSDFLVLFDELLEQLEVGNKI